MPTRLHTNTKNALSDALAELCPSGKIEVRTGSQPAAATAAATGTLLVTLNFDATPFATATGGEAALADTPLTAIAAATGSAGWFRVLNSAGAIVLDGECGASAGQLRLQPLDLTAGVQVQIPAGKILQLG